MLEQGLSYNLQPAFLAEGREHLAEDFGLYVRKDIRERLERCVERAEVGLVKAMAAGWGEGAR